MNIQSQINNLTNKYNLKLEKLKAKLEAEKEQDFEVIKYKNKEFRIYKWENKPFKDFVCPKDFKWCEALELIELINEKKLVGEKGKSYYSLKLFKEGYWELFRAYLLRNGYWSADYDGLALSCGSGRVVVGKVKNV
jgi:hypothetical protein